MLEPGLFQLTLKGLNFLFFFSQGPLHIQLILRGCFFQSSLQISNFLVLFTEVGLQLIFGLLLKEGPFPLQALMDFLFKFMASDLGQEVIRRRRLDPDQDVVVVPELMDACRGLRELPLALVVTSADDCDPMLVELAAATGWSVTAAVISRR